ncbi:MAG TPA: DUF2892 domain-containing protein [Burkholderiaceae bacterium]|nr:DUF2892 domain-containing protein [Burkholderiaceae bacterium]
MKANVGGIERPIRIALGVVLLALAFLGNMGVWGYVAGVIGAVALLTGLAGWCPAWAVFGINTCSVKKP